MRFLCRQFRAPLTTKGIQAEDAKLAAQTYAWRHVHLEIGKSVFIEVLDKWGTNDRGTWVLWRLGIAVSANVTDEEEYADEILEWNSDKERRQREWAKRKWKKQEASRQGSPLPATETTGECSGKESASEEVGEG